MLRKLFKRSFSTLEKLRAAEAIFQVIYHHNDHIKEQYTHRDYKAIIGQAQEETSQFNVEQILAMIKENRRKPRNILSDCIVAKLKKMREEKEISEAVAQKFLDMFDPTKGIKIEDDQWRFDQGKNDFKLFPLNPKSAFFTFLVKLMFKIDEASKKYIASNRSLVGLHIIGTPGFGKSSSFLILKKILNMRINHIIKQGTPRDTIFSQNYKLFYMSSKTSALDIIKKIRQQIIQDFGGLPRRIEDIQVRKQNLGDFISVVKQIYYEKENIQTMLIIDQINNLYSASSKRRKQLEQNWSLTTDFDKPLYLISSKNNIDKERNRILKAICGQTQDVKQVNLDNVLTPEARLCYSVQCLLFQLEKKLLTREKALQVVEQLQQIPLMTHMAIRIALKPIVMEKWNQISKVQIDEIQKALEKDFDNQKLIRNFLQLQEKLDTLKGNTSNKAKKQKSDGLNTKIQQLKQKQKTGGSNTKIQQSEYLQRMTKMIGFSTNNMSYRRIEAIMSFFGGNKTYKNLFRQISLVTRKLNNKQGRYLASLEGCNFFFKGYVLDNAEKIAEESIIVTLPDSKLEQMRQIATSIANPQFLQNLKKWSPQGLKFIVKQRAGQLFENSISSIFQKFAKNDLYKVQLNIYPIVVVAECIYFDSKLRIIPNLDYEFLNTLDKQHRQAKQNQYKMTLIQQQTILNNLAQKLVQEKNSGKGFFVKTQDKNQTFDFLICRLDKTGLLKIVLIDTGIGSYQEAVLPKISKFKNHLLAIVSFKQIIKCFSRREEIKNIQIFFYVLRCHPSYYQSNEVKDPYDIQGLDQQTMSNLQNQIPKLSKVKATAGHFSHTFNLKGKTKGGWRFQDIQSSCNTLMNEIKRNSKNLHS